jgi:hypothetical protein
MEGYLMALALVVMMAVLASWSLIEFALLTITSIRGDLIPQDMKLAVYFMIKDIAIITVCVMGAIYVAKNCGLIS